MTLQSGVNFDIVHIIWQSFNLMLHVWKHFKLTRKQVFQIHNKSKFIVQNLLIYKSIKLIACKFLYIILVIATPPGSRIVQTHL